MGFEFRKIHTIEITTARGDVKEYPCDVTDAQMMEGIGDEFPKIARQCDELAELEQEYKALQAEIQSPDALQKMQGMWDELKRRNRSLIDACKDFIVGTLGEEEYEEIFAGKRPNMLAHMDLCTHIFNWAVNEREDVVEKYIDPPQNREQRRAAKKGAAKDAAATAAK